MVRLFLFQVLLDIDPLTLRDTRCVFAGNLLLSSLCLLVGGFSDAEPGCEEILLLT